MRLTMLTMGLGTVGFIGAAVAVVDPGPMFAAASVLPIVVFHLSIGWRTLSLGNEVSIDLTDGETDRSEKAHRREERPV